MQRHTDDTKQAFLDHYARDGRQNAAARFAGVSPATIARWRATDDEFEAGFQEARQDTVELLEKSAFDKAVEGVVEKRYDKDGNLISERTVYDTTLHVLLLKANAPEKYKDRSSTELSGPGGGKLEISDETAAARIAALLEAVRDKQKALGAPRALLDMDPFS